MNKMLPNEISMSRIETFLECYNKYQLKYIEDYKIPETEHMTFGKDVHFLLEKYFNKEDVVIPELVTSEQQAYLDKFCISSLYEYWEFLKKEVENELTFLYTCSIILTETELFDSENHLHGIIDLIAFDETTNTLYILDYKTSAKSKTLTSLEVEMQLYLYLQLIFKNQDLLLSKGVSKIDNIRLGYINLPKYLPRSPEILKNGKPSKAKAQNTTYDMYLNKLDELELDVSEYDDVLTELKTKKHVEIVSKEADFEYYNKIKRDFLMYYEILRFHYANDYFPECYNEFKCSKCDYYKICKGGI